MQPTKYHILCTRPLTLSLLGKAEEEGIDIEVKEFISIRPIPPGILKKRMGQAIAQPAATVVFTSRNAVEVIARYLSDNIPPHPPAWNVYCIGGHTLERIKEHFPGMKIKGTALDGGRLAYEILKSNSTRQVIFFCGNKRRNDLPDKLRQHQVEIKEVTVYENLPVPQYTPENYDGIIFFSPSAVDSFLEKNQVSENIPCFCVGHTTGDYLAGKIKNKIIIAAKPEEGSMVETLITYFKQ